MFFPNLIREITENGGFASVVIYGRQGVGKTSYAMKNAHVILKDWNAFLNNLLINPKDLLGKISDLIRQNEKAPFLIVDQADLWLTPSRQRNFYRETFLKMEQVASVYTNAFIYTSLTKNLVVKDSFTHIVKIVNLRKEDLRELEEPRKINPRECAVANIYERTNDDYFRLIRRELFRRKLPDEVWKEYQKKRYESLNFHLTELESVVEDEVMKRKPSREEIRQNVLELFRRGYSKREIARLLGISRTTVHNYIKQMQRAV